MKVCSVLTSDMDSFKLLISLLLFVPTSWSLSVASSMSSLSPPSSGDSGSTKDSAAATLGSLYRKSRQSRCVRCYDDRYGDDYERTRYSGGGRGVDRGGSYTSRTNDDRSSNWYYPSERYDRYDDRVRYSGDRDYDRYYYPYNGYYRDRNDDRYSTRTYDRYDRDRYDNRYSYDRSPSENRGYGYDNRDRYYSNDRTNDYYRGGDRYADRNRGSSYDRGYGSDDRYYSRYDYRNYRPWDETYRGQSGFDNSGRGYYFANERPNDSYEPQYQRPQSRPSGPSTPGPTYLPGDHEQSRPSNSHGYPDSRPGSSSSPSSPSSSSSGSDYGNRPRDDVHGAGGGGGGGASGSNGGANGGGSDNKNGYAGGSWSYVNDREKDSSYKGGNRDKDNQSSSYGGGRGRPLAGSYLLDRDNNEPDTSMVSNQDKLRDSSMQDSPTASKLSSPSSTSTPDDRMTESKDSN